MCSRSSLPISILALIISACSSTVAEVDANEEAAVVATSQQLQAKCTDSDQGVSPNVKGSVTTVDASGRSQQKVDSCSGATTLREVVCGANNAAETVAIQCGFGCQSGKCAAAPGRCVDSDGGYNADIAGVVNWRDRAGKTQQTADLCLDGTLLMEAVCDENGFAYNGKTTECAHGCSIGRCNPATCDDSDGGYAPNVLGTVSWIDRQGKAQQTVDICIGNKVMEAVCDASGYAYNGDTTECLHGCSSGRCNPGACSDSDGGYQPFVTGTVTWTDRQGGLQNTVDVCVGNKVMEAVCDANGFAYNGNTTECLHGCVDGHCLQTICTDSDGGYQSAVFGTVTWTDRQGVSNSTPDICIGDNILMEAVCDASGFANNATTTVCAYGCADGKCNPAPDGCVDSDGGYLPDVTGVVSWSDRNGQRQQTLDTCIGSDILMEAVCDASGFANNSQTTRCAHGCVSGHCMAPTCIDSDGGYAADSAGVVSWFDRTGKLQQTSDVCIGENILMEAVCDAQGYANNAQTTTCAAGCSNGRCNPTAPCVDSDGGYQANVFGVVSWTDRNGTRQQTPDTCIGTHILMEAVCDSSGYANNATTTDCPHGCVGGRCAPATCTDSDGGYNANVFGVVQWIDRDGLTRETADTCIGKDIVMEAVCDASGYANNATTTRCPKGCASGRCNP
jgi:hypothetical protein